MRGRSYQSLVLFGLLISSCFHPLTSVAQTGVITGRVITEDGTELPGVMVSLFPVATDRRKSTTGSQGTATDGDGNFKFTGLAPRVYSVSVWTANRDMSVKGYVPRPIPVNERQGGGYYSVGDHVTITMIKGGVITGRVTNAAGEPLIDVLVNAAIVRDAEGNPARSASARLRYTDDRGYYRIYGLSPGTYIVYASNAFYASPPSPYDGKAPTYHPSSTRDTAAEVTVTSGGETSGVDIRYRGEQGHAVSGSVSGSGESSSSYARQIIALTSAVNGAVQSDAHFIHIHKGDAKFATYGVADGEYEITARLVLESEEVVLASTPRRVVVKGADVGGIELKLLPMGSIAGKVALEAAPAVCESKRKWSLEEALLVLRNETKSEGAATAQNQMVPNGLTGKGEFMVYNLTANRYFLEPRLPNENWYVKTITGPASTAAPARGATERGAPTSDAARNGIALKAGEKISGVTVTISDGAAGVSGKVVPAAEGARLSARLRVHLVPAEATAANEVLRYAEMFARSDGSFSLSNIAPGKYWLIARAAPNDEMKDRLPEPLAWDASERAKLRKESEAMKIELELKPCQRVSDQVVKFR